MRQRQLRGGLDAIEHDVGSDATHALNARQAAQYRFGQCIQIGRHNLEDVVGLAGHRIAFQHFRKQRNLALKRTALFPTVAGEDDVAHGPHGEAQRGGVEQGHIAADDAG